MCIFLCVASIYIVREERGVGWVELVIKKLAEAGRQGTVNGALTRLCVSVRRGASSDGALIQETRKNNNKTPTATEQQKGVSE